MKAGGVFRNIPVYVSLLVGTLAGLIVSEITARFLGLREGKHQLSAYAQQVQNEAIHVDQEGEAAVATVLRDHLFFCSPEELRLMRGIVYKSLEIKDIGRIRNGSFVCSSELGVVEKPYVMPPAKQSIREMKLYGWTPVLLGARNKGFVVQVKDVDFVLNPRAFEAFENQPKSFAAYFYDSPTGSLIQGFGVAMPLTNAEIIAGGEIERKGVFYNSLCSAKSWVCVVAAEPKKAIFAANKPFHHMLLVAGASIGDTTALALLLLYRRHRSQAKQLRRAVRRRKLRVVYQPIVDLSSEAWMGMEALVRWTNEDGEVVPPDVFIAIAERQLFVTEITRLVVHTCLKEVGEELRTKAVRLTINITAQDLSDATFVPYLKDALHEAGVQASQLGLELTERSAADQPAAIQAIAELRRAGHFVYIDDFGTGYSSLASLAQLQADALKIDRAFTASIGTHSVTEAILPQVMQMAQQLNLLVVVEGIETVEQAEYFRARHTGILGQGWLFGRPMAAAQVRSSLNEIASVRVSFEEGRDQPAGGYVV